MYRSHAEPGAHRGYRILTWVPHSAAGGAPAEVAGAITTDEGGEPWRLGGASLIGAATPAVLFELIARARA
jgi:hypothetical protein